VLREALPFELQRSSTTYLKDGFWEGPVEAEADS
jgi:hypothetical protein